jgi:polar amino acid transport system permease protein
MGMKNRRTPPWYRQTRFHLACAAILVLYLIVVLPGAGRLSTVGRGVNVLSFLLFAIVVLALFVTDKLKPEWMKTTSVLLFMFLLGWLFYRYAGADWSRFFQLFLNFAKMQGKYHLFIQPTLLILQMAGYSCVYAVVIGAVLALFRSLDNPVTSWLVSVYVTFFRSFPAIVLLVLVYYALPFVGIKLSSFNAVIVGLSLFYSAYTTEIFRAGIESVARTQIEAARVLGFSGWQTMRLVIAPQAVRIVIPPLTSQLIAILKTTSISYVVGVLDLITMARQLQAYLMVVTPLIVVSCIYLVVVIPFVILSDYLEHRSRQWSHRAGP